MPPHCSAAEPTGTAPPRVRQLSAPLPRHKATCAVARLLSAPLGKLATRTNCRTVNHRSPPHCLKNHTDPGERGGPSRKRRQSPSSGIGHDSAVLKPTMRLLQYPRPADDRQNQGLAPAEEATAKRLCGIGQGGSCRPVNPALVLAEPVRKCVRGPPRQTPRPQEPAIGRAGKSASSAPLLIRGVAGASPPAEGVAGDSAAAPAQGKAFPIT